MSWDFPCDLKLTGYFSIQEATSSSNDKMSVASARETIP